MEVPYQYQSINILSNSSSSTPNQISTVLSYPVNFKEWSVALSSLYIYYSWPNISPSYANQSYSYIFNNTTYSITMPLGNYEISDLNGYLEFEMNLNGHYLLDQNSSPVYFLEFQENSVYYAITLTATPIPASLPSGWTNPKNITLSGVSPQIVIPSTVSNDGLTSISILTGFTPGTYPTNPSSSIYQVNSQNAPQISPVTSVQVLVNCAVPSFFNSNPSTIYNFTSNVSYGSLISVIPNPQIFFPVADGTYSQLTITLVDQNNRPLPILDPEINATLYFRKNEMKRVNRT